MRNLYRTVYLSDIYERHNIENKAEFEELVRILASSVGSPVNPTNLANTFKTVKRLNNITDKTNETYIGYLEDAFMIEKSERYDIKGENILVLHRNTISKTLDCEMPFCLSARQKRAI